MSFIKKKWKRASSSENRECILIYANIWTWTECIRESLDSWFYVRIQLILLFPPLSLLHIFDCTLFCCTLTLHSPTTSPVKPSEAKIRILPLTCQLCSVNYFLPDCPAFCVQWLLPTYAVYTSSNNHKNASGNVAVAGWAIVFHHCTKSANNKECFEPIWWTAADKMKYNGGMCVPSLPKSISLLYKKFTLWQWGDEDR